MCELSFQHTATRRWLGLALDILFPLREFQHTATRRWLVFRFVAAQRILAVSTHSHPKVAGTVSSALLPGCVFQHTATRRWLVAASVNGITITSFQHTATRRWLGVTRENLSRILYVSTHSHPKVAGSAAIHTCSMLPSFNTQPPEGGWTACHLLTAGNISFNTQPPEGGW